MFKWLFLEAAVLNAVLRLSPHANMTFFRILLPFFAVVFFIKNTDKLIYFIIVLYLLFFFQGISWLISDYPITLIQLTFAVNYITMIFLFIYVKDLIYKSVENVYNFLVLNYVALIAFLCIQYSVGYRFPNIPYPGAAVNAWYWNENDASLALASFIILSLYLRNFNKLIILHALAIVIIYYNGSRAALMGMVLFIVLSFFLKEDENNSMLGFLKIPLILGAAGAAILLMEFNVFSFYKEIQLSVQSVFESVITLDIDASVIDSLGLRVQLLIYSIIEFIDSGLMGIGAGNSMLMLETGKYPSLSLVKSIHNMPFQLLLELGIVLAILTVFYLKSVSRLSWAVFFTVLSGFAFISLTQSGGFIANFYVLYCFTFIINYRAAKDLENYWHSPQLISTKKVSCHPY